MVHDGVLPDKLYAAVSVPPLRLEKHPAELLVVLRPFRFAVSIERRTDDVLAQKCQRVKILLLDIGVVALLRLCFVAFDRGELLCRDIFDDAQIAPDLPAVLEHGISLGEAHIQTALLSRFDEIPDVVELVDHGAKQLIDLLAVKELAQQIKHLDKIIRPFCRQHKIAFTDDLADKIRDLRFGGHFEAQLFLPLELVFAVFKQVADDPPQLFRIFFVDRLFALFVLGAHTQFGDHPLAQTGAVILVLFVIIEQRFEQDEVHHGVKFAAVGQHGVAVTKKIIFFVEDLRILSFYDQFAQVFDVHPEIELVLQHHEAIVKPHKRVFRLPAIDL